MVDAADRDKIEASRNELHNLLDKPQLQGIPVSNITLNTIKCLWGMCIIEQLWSLPWTLNYEAQPYWSV